MRLYKIGLPDAKPRFAGSMDGARAARRTLWESDGGRKMDIAIAEVEVPTNKEGLIAFLNELMK